MKLITKEILKKIPPTYKKGVSNDAGLDPVIYLKLFTPWSIWRWYIAQYDPKTGEMFGYVEGFKAEWGCCSLIELEEIKGPCGLKIERDLHFTPKKFSECGLKNYQHEDI